MDSEEVAQINWFGGEKSPESKRDYFVLNTLLDFEPVKRANEWAGMGGFRSEYDCASKRVLNALKTRQFVSREREIEGVAIVKFRMNKRRGDYAGSFEI